jgi:hypothetical protein
MQGLLAGLDSSFVSVDRRSSVLLRLEGDDALDTYRFMFTLDEFTWETTLVATSGDRLALTRDTVSFVDGQAGPAEVTYLNVVQVDEHGMVVTFDSFDPDDLDAAYAALDARYAELAPSDNARVGIEWFENDAWRTHLRVRDAAYRRDIEGIREAVHPEAVSIDRNNAGLRLEGDAFFDPLRILLALDEFTWDIRLLATRGDRLALTSDTVSFVDGRAGPTEIVLLNLIEVDEHGREIRSETFPRDDLDAAYDALEDRWVADGATALGRVMTRAFDARDWDTFASVFASDFTITDFRTAGWGTVNRDTLVEYHRGIAELSHDARFRIDHARRHGNVTSARRASSARIPAAPGRSPLSPWA